MQKRAAGPRPSRSFAAAWQSGRQSSDATTSWLPRARATWRSPLRRQRYAEAEPLHRRALEIREAKLGRNHPDLAIGLNSLGQVLVHLERYGEAEQLYRRSLEIRETKLGPDHLDVAKSLAYLAKLYSATRRYAEAEPLLRRCLAIRQSKLGPDHLVVAGTIADLALLLDSLGHHAESGPLYRRSLRIKENTLGYDNPAVANLLHDLAIASMAEGRSDEAVDAIDRGRHIVRRHLAGIVPALGVDEQLGYFKIDDDRRVSIALSLALARCDERDTVNRSTGWVLNVKAMAPEVLALRCHACRTATAPIPPRPRLSPGLRARSENWLP